MTQQPGYPQQYPPQGYPQPAQPQYPPAPGPQGYPQPAPQGPPPGYPPAPAGQQPPSPVTQPGPAGAPAAGGDDPFGMPGAPVGGSSDGPAIHQLDGRLVLFRPSSYDELSPGYKGGDPGPMARADIVVCDGEPIVGNLDGTTMQMTPFASGPKAPPFFVKGMYIRGKVLPGQLKDYAAGRQWCLGRVVRGNPGSTGKPPWILADPTEQDKVIGRQIHARWNELEAAAAPVQPQPQQFGAPGQAPAGYPPQGYAQPQPQYPAQPAYGAPQGYPQPAPYGYPGGAAQNPYGAPAQQPGYPSY